jgi:hypothetical protein
MERDSLIDGYGAGCKAVRLERTRDSRLESPDSRKQAYVTRAREG